MTILTVQRGAGKKMMDSDQSQSPGIEPSHTFPIYVARDLSTPAVAGDANVLEIELLIKL